MYTDLQAAQAALSSVATTAHQLANNLQSAMDSTVLDGLLAGAISGQLDLLALTCTKLGQAPGYRILVDAQLAAPLAANVSPQHAANLRSCADALDTARATLANMGQAIRDAAGDL